ncbi:Aerobactin synthase [Bacillus sp. THAF10]|uniref:IucA/IucC family protein n=1 Tax=Bacillus sp. THAF10 TaxID=2587848 RepID=UPI0012A83EB4|nr:IucA/IucC family protein [Bacillus sp. THAF10]QFT89105.1 Aerobactin synthase [Bacillus sp. THAF10]
MQQLSQSKSELRVWKQLLEAIVFENLLPVSFLSDEKETNIHISGQNVDYICRGEWSSFSRFRIFPETIVQTDKQGNRLPLSLFRLTEGLVPSHAEQSRLLEELQQTILLCEWNEKHLSFDDRRKLPLEELDAAVVEGHPYHPCFKARTGFSVKDHQEFGPENGKSFQLFWVAVKRKHVRLALPCEEKRFYEKELGEKTFSFLLDSLHKRNLSLKDYCLLPVHPWQWKQKLSYEADTNDIIPIGSAGDYYHASQSVRSLWNKSNKEKATIKLPLNMVNTSSLRTLEPHSICTAPTISSWLEKIIQSDAYLKKNVSILKEYAGIVAFEKNDSLCGHVAAIWRESGTSKLAHEEEAAPFNALTLYEKDHSLLIAPWIETYGLEKWVEQLIQVTIVPVWHLFVAHGLAVEAHAQNMILVHRNGWPKRVMLRDFHESLEYSVDFLKEKALHQDISALHPDYQHAPNDQYYWMSSVEGLRELVMDTLFVFHLSDLSYVLEKEFHFSEDKFWRLIQVALENHTFHSSELKKRAKEIKYTDENIKTESLFTRKISTKKAEFHHIVKNSLARSGK